MPIVVNRHEAGVECVVRKILWIRYSVSSSSLPGGIDGEQDQLTSLTVKWPSRSRNR